MIFQKKIIIGSIMSFIATAIGIIAVFFPDLLNMQKEKIEKLRMDIVTNEKLMSFDEFLSKRVEDGKVFELDVLIAPSLDSVHINEGRYKSPTRSYTPDEISDIDIDEIDFEVVELDNAILIIHHGDIMLELPDKSIKWKWDEGLDWGEGLFDRIIGGGAYSFPKKALISNDAFPRPREPLSKDIEDGCCYGIKGVFYYSESSDEFKQVSDEQLKLKNY